VKAAPLLATPAGSRSLAAKLWPLTLLRGLVALALGAYALSRPIDPPALARLVSVYWIFDGVVALWASRFAATLAANRVFLAVRGAVGIVAAVLLLGLPLADIFGPWRPGQLMLFLVTLTPALVAVGVQIVMAVTIDMVIGLEVRRRIPGEWSIALGAVLSIALGALVAGCFIGFSTVPGRALGPIAVAGGLGLLAGAFRLKPAAR
jgi:uncharacterized membrane protein HdeD (DUF308 family)